MSVGTVAEPPFKTMHGSEIPKDKPIILEYPASLAVDDNLDTDPRQGSCSSTKQEDNPWLIVDLGSAAHIKKVWDLSLTSQIPLLALFILFVV